MIKENALYDSFEKTLEEGLTKVCTSAGLLDGTLLVTDDHTGKWNEFIQDYVADAVLQFNDYPEATIAWPGFIGIAIATMWDKNWEVFKDIRYKDLYGPRGFDDMDEHILKDIAGLDLEGEEATKLSETLNSCALATLALMRHEGLEPQTADGFFLLARAYTVMFRIGVSLALYKMSYRLQRL